MPSTPITLEEILRVVPRRYRLPGIDGATSRTVNANPAATLAIAIEQGRLALASGAEPASELRHVFIEALARMIRDAMRSDFGDSAFQAMVLRHRMAQVREYATLFAHAEQDRRQVHAAVNAIAHPAKVQRTEPGPLRDMLARLQENHSSASWQALQDTVRQVLAMPLQEAGASEPSLSRGLNRLLEGSELMRLQRLDALASDEYVRQYQALWDSQGPRPGSDEAAAQGIASQQRGDEVEALASRALEALARRMNEDESVASAYRVVTSMRVPASIPGSHERAKTEWDAVLLRRAPAMDGADVWDVCLLLEAKASVDAATTDFARLLRGLSLLAQAENGDAVYAFETRQGTVPLRGASLRALPSSEANVANVVLYCCDSPVEDTPRLLGAPSRMQLLSAQASVEFASALAEGRQADPGSLAAVWRELIESPQWRGVLHQYPMLRQVRELMVHADDLLAVVDDTEIESSSGQ